eukprot:TRINITY_DN3064_c0_g4_i1.p1 TRINITY_DN3064_c0_g4~~TRINITY_DN3064_c0_g4_i1.p1  ORF type:complete len:141 (-),score=18.14 TRINITY_DN3064_c0_g4_i1:29-451(-)
MALMRHSLWGHTLISLLSLFLPSLSCPSPPIIVYEILLVKFGLTDYIMEHPRSNLIHANKEGIMSSLGYYAMFLIGAQLGNILRRERTRGEWINLLVSSIAIDALLWGVLLYTVDNVEAVSRRMVGVNCSGFSSSHVSIG